MKTKLLLLSLVCGFASAQAPVASYYGTHNAVFTIVTPTGINHTPSGANVSWNFSGLVDIGQSVDTESVPTAAELISFPGTGVVMTTESTYYDSSTATFKIYSKSPAGALSITGIDNSELLLNYISNNALIGTFPLEYGYNNVDNVGGNYDNGQYSGTFSGTINTTVDGWGMLSLSGNVNTYLGPATRLKTVQNLTLNYGIFTNVGTVNITTYSYYGNNLGTGIPRFRSTITDVNVPLLSIDQTVVQNEAFTAVLLGNNEFSTTTNAVVIAPNPATDMLSIASGAQKVLSVELTDISGKMVMRTASGDIDISGLQRGIYFAAITTESGTSTQKFIKK